MATPATNFSEREHEICLVAQLRTGVDGGTGR